MGKQLSQEKSGLATTGMVLGIIGIVLSPIPIINNIAFILGALAFIFGIVGLVQTKNGQKLGRGKAITAVVLAAIGIVIVLLTQQMFSKAIDEATKDSNSNPSTSAPSNSSTQPAWDMEAAYTKVENGMTKAQVEEATGKKSDNCTESQSEYFGKSEVCHYGNAFIDKGSIMVTYSQDKVSSKTKSNY